MIVRATLARADASARGWDVLVAGAGPAGSALARRAAVSGLRTLLVDRSAFPRDKVCGGCLSARTLELFERAGLAGAVRVVGGAPLDRLVLAAGGHCAELRLPAGLSLSRYRLDASLLAAAVAAGAHFLPRQRAVLGAASGAGREVALHDGGGSATVRAAVVVDATGLSSALVGSAAPRALPVRDRIGCAAILPAEGAGYPPGAIHMAVARRGYVGLVRLEDGRLNVAAALDAGTVRRRGPGPVAAGILRQAGFDPVAGLAEARWSGTPPLAHRPQRCAGERLFALGDAAGYTEPFTGEGIGWALRDADALAPLLEQAVGGWEAQLAEQWSRRQARERAYTQRSSRVLAGMLRRPLLVRGALGILQRRPGLGQPLVRRVQGGAAWP